MKRNIKEDIYGFLVITVFLGFRETLGVLFAAAELNLVRDKDNSDIIFQKQN